MKLKMKLDLMRREILHKWPE